MNDKYNTTVINAITGKTLPTNIDYFMAIDDFKHFIVQQWLIPLDQIFILLPYGAKLKKSNFKDCLREHNGRCEFYVFDRRLFSLVNDPRHMTTEAVLNSPVTQDVTKLLESANRSSQVTLIRPINSPLLDANLSSNSAGSLTGRRIVSLLTTNLGWLSALEIDVHYFHKVINDTLTETQQMFNCLNICQQYLKVYCYDVEKLYNSNVEFVTNLEKNSNSKNWHDVYDNVLDKLPLVIKDGTHDRLSQYLNKGQLENDYKLLCECSRGVNSKLCSLKDQIDENYKFRQTIGSASNELKLTFQEDKSKYEMEDNMMDKFSEMVKKMKEESHEILNQELVDFTSEYTARAIDIITENKNSVVPKLYTIAQALYTQASNSLERKKTLQECLIRTLGQIAFVQIHILEIKESILKECNKDLEFLQEHELVFSQVDDLPLVYGLFLIENFRRNLWFEQVKSYNLEYCEDFKIITDNEKRYRNKWTNNFGSIAQMFEFQNRQSYEWLEQLTENSRREASEHNTSSISLQEIETYIFTLSKLGISTSLVQLLKRSLEEVKQYKITVGSNRKKYATGTCPTVCSQSSHSQVIDPDVIRGYKTRIRKLESLLHDAQVCNIASWPSGILNNASLSAFQNNTPSVNSKLPMWTSNIKEKSRKSEREKDLEASVSKLLEQVDSLTKENIELNDKAKSTRGELLSIEDECNAYRETLTKLNKELSRLTAEQEQQKIAQLTEQNDFKTQLETIIKNNTELSKDLDSWKDKYGTLNVMKDDLLANMANMENDFIKERVGFQDDIETLKRELTELKVSNHEEEDDQSSLGTRSDEISDEMNSLKKFNKDMESKLFQIFASSVFILENIGLLLSKSNDGKIQITRVKGLRKGMANSIIDSTTTSADSQVIVKSNVFQTLKKLYESVESNNELNSQQLLLTSVAELFNNKLYESSVIKRFKDIESLAKKLTKENKFKRGLLDAYQREKITIKNFQIGDLALFLPTRDTGIESSLASSFSSLNSSFSSVDLSTPPPPGATSNQLTVKTKHKNSHSNKSRPWAAFTAFEEYTTRYFLKESDEIIQDRDWFVGRITTMERHVVDNNNFNPFKLPQNTVWFHVSAELLNSINK